MQNETRVLFDQFTSRVAQLNGVSDVAKTFSVEPSVSQTLEAKIQESSEFLTQINLYPVPELIGEKLGMGVSQRIASRTDTSGNARRNPKDPTGLSGRGFELKQTNFDTALPYGKLDQWAKFPNFQTMIGSVIAQAIALDRITIGFNGTTAAATTDPAAHPLLEDVNVGWLEYLRTEAPTHVFDHGAHAVDKIRIGADPATTDYRTLDALVYDAIFSFLPTWARKRTDLVAITSGELLHDKYFPLVNSDQDPTEQIARDYILSTKRLGGRQAAEVPFFIDNAVLVTPLKNLSIYYQEGKRRRHIIEEPDANRVADYQSSNEGYVVEDPDLALLIEGIEIVEDD